MSILGGIDKILLEKVCKSEKGVLLLHAQIRKAIVFFINSKEGFL